MRGIVFEGGGAKGAYQIGAAKALQEMGFEFDAIAGTSVGALNGAAVAQDDILRAYGIWDNIDNDKVFRMDEFREAKKNRSAYVKLMKKIIEDRGLDTEPLNRIIYDFVDEEKIRNRKVIFGIVTVSFKEFRHFEIYLDEIPEGRLSEYIIASANFPLFKAAKIDGRRFADGGFYNNYPINMLVDKGVRDIVSVRTFGIGIVRSCDLKDSLVTYIEPKEKLGPILDFSRDRVQKNLKLGYFDAYKVIKKHLGNTFYIDNDLGKDYIYNKLLTINFDNVRPLAESMGINDADPGRFFFEMLIPRIAEYLGLDRSAGYNDVVLSILEVLAEEKKLERYRIYKYSEFADAVIDNYREAEAVEILKYLPGFLTRNDLLPKTIKNKIMKEVAVRIIKENY
jgi:NTE family protein